MGERRESARGRRGEKGTATGEKTARLDRNANHDRGTIRRYHRVAARLLEGYRGGSCITAGKGEGKGKHSPS